MLVSWPLSVIWQWQKFCCNYFDFKPQDDWTINNPWSSSKRNDVGDVVWISELELNSLAYCSVLSLVEDSTERTNELMETVSLNTVPDRTSKIWRYASYFWLCSLCLENVLKLRLSFLLYITRGWRQYKMVTFSIFYHVCFFGKSTYNHQYYLHWQEFHRQGDSNTIDQHKLPVPVTARFLRFNPTQRHAWNCLRVEVYGTERELLPLLTYLISGSHAKVWISIFCMRCGNVLRNVFETSNRRETVV